MELNFSRRNLILCGFPSLQKWPPREWNPSVLTERAVMWCKESYSRFPSHVENIFHHHKGEELFSFLLWPLCDVWSLPKVPITCCHVCTTDYESLSLIITQSVTPTWLIHSYFLFSPGENKNRTPLSAVQISLNSHWLLAHCRNRLFPRDVPILLLDFINT